MSDPTAIDLDAECALATIGFGSILDGEPRWGAGRREEAGALVRRINRALRSFLAQPEPAPIGSLPSFAYDGTRVLLDEAEGHAERNVAALIAALGEGDLALAVLDKATNILHGLMRILPRAIRHELTGDVPELPSDSEVARFARSWHVAETPAIVFDDLRDHSLAFDQAFSFAAFYPALFAATRRILVDALIDLKAKRPSYALGSTRDRLLRLLLGAGAHNAALAADYQRLAGSPEPPPPPGRGATVGPPDLQTPGQRPIGAARRA